MLLTTKIIHVFQNYLSPVFPLTVCMIGPYLTSPLETQHFYNKGKSTLRQQNHPKDNRDSVYLATVFCAQKGLDLCNKTFISSHNLVIWTSWELYPQTSLSRKYIIYSVSEGWPFVKLGTSLCEPI